jgi:hypothetical protein
VSAGNRVRARRTRDGTWRTVSLDRAEQLSFYFCSGDDVATASGRQVDDDIAGVGCS